MKKGKSGVHDALRAAYKRADFPGGLVRGKYAARVATRSHVVRLDPDVAAAFPTSESVNCALTKVIRGAKTTRSVKRPARGTEKPAKNSSR